MGNRVLPLRCLSPLRGFSAAAILAALASVGTGCGGVECGVGTVEVNGVCTAGVPLRCAAGFTPLGDRCVPDEHWMRIYCDENNHATYDPRTHMCIGTGGGNVCTKTCPPASESRICIQGRVFEGLSLYSKGADGATALSATDGAIVKVYDPIAFVSNPTGTPPVKNGTVAIEANGCFIATDVEIPFAGFFAIAVDDATGQDNWAFAALGHTPTPGTNATNLEVPAFKNTTTQAWGSDLVAQGTMLMRFQDLNKNPVAGVTPTLDTKAPPWTSESLPPVLYFGDDISQPPVPAASEPGTTSKSGLVAVRKAPVKTFGGNKQGCTVEARTGGSSPGTLFIVLRNVTGC